MVSIGHSQFGAKALEATADVCGDRGRGDVEDVSDLGVCPAAPVCEPDRDSLCVGEFLQRTDQTWLDVGDVHRFVAAEQAKGFALACAGLADTEQLADRVGHLREPVPVFERVTERLGHRVVDAIDPHGTEQRPTQAWFGLAGERVEGSVRPHAVRILTR
jgi:hypothetical protein